MTNKQKALIKETEIEALENRELDAVVLVDEYGFEWSQRELDNATEEYEVKINLEFNRD